MSIVVTVGTVGHLTYTAELLLQSLSPDIASFDH